MNRPIKNRQLQRIHRLACALNLLEDGGNKAVLKIVLSDGETGSPQTFEVKLQNYEKLEELLIAEVEYTRSNMDKSIQLGKYIEKEREDDTNL